MAAMAISHHHHPYASRPVYSGPPPSPPMEHVKCTLPSISNLIGLADAGSPTHEHPPALQTRSPRSEAPTRRLSAPRSDSRPSSGYASAFPHHSRGFPPSPPMSTDASLEPSSPCQKSVAPFPAPAPATGYYHEATPPLETDVHHRQPYHHQHSHSHPRASPPRHHHHHHHHRHHQSVSTPQGSYFPPTSAAAPPSGLAYQRPLPQSFPPAPAAVAAPPQIQTQQPPQQQAPSASPSPTSPGAGAISWQHHHYLNPAPGHLFPQSQDRYICQTCNKAFSRPSSLRIHSHSHTGEKPFKCSQAGCGKAFSVRSNMKRHERGCHSVEVKGGAVLA